MPGSGGDVSVEVDNPIGMSLVRDRATSSADQPRARTENGRSSIHSPEELSMQRR
jgi:hypothetical protein